VLLLKFLNKIVCDIIWRYKPIVKKKKLDGEFQNKKIISSWGEV